MATHEPQILDGITETIAELASDWEYENPVTTETYLFGDLGFESLDLVVLGASLQEKYGRLPFAELLAEIGQRENQDISVGELATFISKHAGKPVTGEVR